MDDLLLHTHERSETHARADLVDAILAVETRDLKPAERVRVLEHLSTAVVHDRRHDQLGGAAYLVEVAGRPDTPAREATVLGHCATSFVRAR